MDKKPQTKAVWYVEEGSGEPIIPESPQKRTTDIKPKDNTDFRIKWGPFEKILKALEVPK